MTIRFINGINVEYRSEEWNGTDTSGIRLVGKTVLILTDKCVRSAGGIEFDPGKEEQLNAASDTGVLVACAPGAFLINEDCTPWTGEKPKPGDYVFIEKYAGRQVTGRDGKVYRMMDYGAIGATYEKGAAAESDVVEGATAFHVSTNGRAPAITLPK